MTQIKEFLVEVATQFAEERYGDNTYVEQENGDFLFTDEAQDVFNDKLCEYERMYDLIISESADGSGKPLTL